MLKLFFDKYFDNERSNRRQYTTRVKFYGRNDLAIGNELKKVKQCMNRKIVLMKKKKLLYLSVFSGSVQNSIILCNPLQIFMKVLS